MQRSQADSEDDSFDKSERVVNGEKNLSGGMACHLTPQLMNGELQNLEQNYEATETG